LPTYSKNIDLNGQKYGRWAGLSKLPNRERRSVFMDISTRHRIEMAWFGVVGQNGNIKDLCSLVPLLTAGDGSSIPTGAGLICTAGAFVALPCRTRLAA
jgi:hypothetical protein